MAAGNDVYDLTDYANASAAGGGATSTRKGGMMTKSNLRSVAYFAIVGGIVVYLVAHLAPIKG